MELPHCDDLFMRFFDPWYTDETRALKRFQATRPDLLTVDSFANADPNEISPLDEDGRHESARRVHIMTDAAISDLPKYLLLTSEVDIEWVRAFDAYYDREKIRDMLNDADPNDFENSYLIACCEFGSLIGRVLSDRLPTLSWVYSWPYWESSILHVPTGSIIPPYHWAIKKMSEYGVDDGFAEKIEMCVQMLRDQENAV